MLTKHKFISTQSEWVRAHIKSYNTTAKIFNTRIPLRKHFYESETWKYKNCQKRSVFTYVSSFSTFKGMHILIDAIAILCKRMPDINLIIAGHSGKGLRESGYVRFLKRKIRCKNLTDKIKWVGQLNAENIIKNQLKANVVVIPSFIESYGLAIEESLAIGTPTVAAYSGAIPERGINNNSILFYPPPDSVMCAESIESILTNNELANKLSKNSINNFRSVSLNENLNVQLDIYSQIKKHDSNNSF